MTCGIGLRSEAKEQRHTGLFRDFALGSLEAILENLRKFIAFFFTDLTDLCILKWETKIMD